MYKGILLDLDNTLYQYQALHEVAFSKQIAYLANISSYSTEEITAAYSTAKTRVKNTLPAIASSHNRLLYAQVTCELLSIDALSHSLKLYNIYWDSFIQELQLSQDALQFFANYGHLPICLVTDLTADIQHKKIAHLELMKWVNFVVTSEEAGCEKPHPFIFDLALRKLNLTSSQVCMIGDNYQKDIIGAKQLGIHAYWLSPDEYKEDGITQVASLGDIRW
jgi:HAD superfamily hydrolase (TIGR01549 family)